MIYFRAWYRPERHEGALDPNFPEWVVYAEDEEMATEKVLRAMSRPRPDRGYRIVLLPIEGEDEGTIAFATAQQTGQALL